MTKPRRKSEIRTRASQQIAELNKTRDDIGCHDWRLIFLNALIDGLNVTKAAAVAGVGRARVYAEQRNVEFDRAMEIARYYGDNRIKWISRPIWPPCSQTVQRHEATMQRIESYRRNELVAFGL